MSDEVERVEVDGTDARGEHGKLVKAANACHKGSDGQERILVETDSGELMSVPTKAVRRERGKKTFAFFGRKK